MSTEQSCPIPQNEPQRLKAVSAMEVLDTGPEVEFDALARVAAHAFSAPFAYVGVLDSDRLWFKARLGLEIAQIDRKLAFCAHAVMRPKDAMVVSDLANDPRFAEHPLVTGPSRLRFYAGAAVLDARGYALGSIAVLDTQPRTFTDAQRDTLVDLAGLVTTALQGRLRAIDLERLALTDHLTGIANRAHFGMALDAESGFAMRTGEPFSVLSMDLDGFRNVNEVHGHIAGDEVLHEVARRLRQLVRKGDTLARLGGDKFGVVVRHGDDTAAAVLVHRIARAVEEPIQLSSGAAIHVGISVGVATYSDTIGSTSELMALANRALTQAKGHWEDAPTLAG
jgi:diguanylate cyclase (GGDEF)-like protein